MVRIFALLLVAFAAFPAAGFAQIAHPGGDQYLVLDGDLMQLKKDFNAAKGSVRLVFIIGPTCGICLRGMADLNDALLAERQGDDRLQTFAVHVPVLSATEAHVKDSMPLMMGPNIYHYWDPTGIIGVHYRDVLGIGNVYAWDAWFAYGPDAEWTETLPPAPAFWQHQLSPLPRELYLDAKDFAKRTVALMDKIGTGAAAQAAPDASEGPEVDVDFVIQTPARVAQTYLDAALGGRENIESLSSYRMQGRVITARETLPLSIQASRPGVIERSASVLPPALAGKLEEAFDFEGVLYDWGNKDNKLSTRGMVKLKAGLAWRIDMITPKGDHWELLVDSHTGNTVRQRLLAADRDSYLLEVSYSNFRKIEGISFPHRVEYRDGEGRLIATVIYDQVALVRAGE